LRPVVHRDSRGFFIETYHQDKLASLGIEDCIVQDNHSRSTLAACGASREFRFVT
jgi:dTDP-4-dehydrorhamnose 3,5-epimerase